MISIISRLVAGDQSVAKDFKKANQFWADFFEKNSELDVKDLAKAISKAQISYEHTLSGDHRPYKKETMALTCLAHLHEVGEDQKLVNKVVKAFSASDVSLEIKGAYLKEACALYDIRLNAKFAA